MVSAMPGRNDPCPCGSGKKFKKCCGAAAQAAVRTVAASPDTEAAFALYQQGNLAAAASAAESALARGDKRPELYELLGGACYQLGDFGRAADAIAAQLKLQPGNALAHNNLSLILLAMGDWQSAYQHGQQAITLQPELASAYNNLGNAYKCGHWLKEAEDAYQTAISKGYVNPGVYVNLGAVQQEQANWAAAEASYRQALQLDANFFPALSNLAVALQKAGKYAEAEAVFRQALELNPDDAETLNNAGSYWLEKNEPVKARQYLNRALELDPDYIGAHVNLGLIHELEEETGQAVACYEQVLSIDPGNATANCNLAAILYSQGETQRAMELYRAAVKANPHLAVAIAGMAQTLLDTDNVKLAEEYMARAMELNPEDPFILKIQSELLARKQQYGEAVELLQNFLKAAPENKLIQETLAEVHQKSGDYTAAAEIYARLVGSAPDSDRYKFGWAVLEEKRANLQQARELFDQMLNDGSQLPELHIQVAHILLRQKDLDAALAELEKIDTSEFRNKRVYKSFLFEYARVLEKQGRYPEAFEKYVEANDIKNEIAITSYDADETKKEYQKAKEVFSAEFCQNLPIFHKQESDNTPTPVFVVGFPRSGTTLLEQIIGSHPEVSAGGELVYIWDLLRGGTGSKILNSDKPYPDWLDDQQAPLSQSDLQKLRNYYLESVHNNNIVEPGKRLFTDKMPLNLIYLGVITMLFPESPILHIVRHPLDSCFSSYISDFAFGHHYTATLEDTASHYAAVMDLVKYYKSALKMNYMELHYEDLIADQETLSRQVIDFIGLPWNEQCLKFYEHKRVANTASYAQVNQKIYSSSKFRYKNYYTQMQPIVPILQETLDYFGYTVEP